MSSDIELLRLCLEAFEAIPVAAKSRKVIKKIGKTPGAYAGNGSHILAGIMAGIILARLEETR